MLFEIGIILGLVLLNGVFAGAEIAVISVRATRLTELLDARRRGARAVRALRDDPERFLATVQVGITIVSTAAAAFGGETLAADLTPHLRRLPYLGPYAPQLALVAVIAALSYLSLILGELVPKSLALRASERYALAIAGPLLLLSRLTRPLVWWLTRSSNAVLRIFNDTTSFTESRLSPDELQELVREAGRVGSLDARTSEIASRALDLPDLTAAAVMVPRTEIVGLPLEATNEAIAEVITRHRHARMPVYRGNIDNVVGYVSMRDLLPLALRGQTIDLARHMRPAQFVPRTMRAVELLKALQRMHTTLALVVDEAGGVAGLVTVEDLVEEVVGEIVGEHDPDVEWFQREADGAVRVQGVAPLRELNRALALRLPEAEGYTTLAGLCLQLAGRIPVKGAHLTLEDGTVMEILEATPRRVQWVRLRPPPPGAPGSGESGG